jgi:hypothetical protein
VLWFEELFKEAEEDSFVIEKLVDRSLVDAEEGTEEEGAEGLWGEDKRR